MKALSFLLTPFLTVCLVSAISLSAAHHEEGIEMTGRAIVDGYVETQEVDSELAYIRMTIVLPGPRLEERRFLAVYRKDPEGGRGSFIRLVRPPDVEGVTLLAI